jgi:hypothetical protein
MPATWDIFSAIRLTTIIQAYQDVRNLPQELKFLQRINVNPAVDGELFGRFQGQVLIADLVSDDAEAVTYTQGKFQLERNISPNMKHGRFFSQERLKQLAQINGSGGIQNDNGIFSNYINNEVDALLLGIRQRMEALIIAMHLDGFSYDRLGIKMSNVTWGMPSTYKITVGVGWSNPATAKPIDDILNIKRIANVQYGKVYNRITMSTAAFNLMIATQQFQDRVKIILNPAMPVAALPYQDTVYMQNLAQNLLGMQIEFYDARYWQQAPDGTITATAYLPLNMVIIDSTENDHNDTIQDFSNGVVTESVVSSMVSSSMVGSLGGPQFGPVAYATAPTDLNPPNIAFWGVATGFPRKYQPHANAVLNVGTVNDDVPIVPPF